jgi:hypothetical protein
MRESQPAPVAALKIETIAEHTMKPDETLSHLALKYYGSAVREKVDGDLRSKQSHHWR